MLSRQICLIAGLAVVSLCPNYTRADDLEKSSLRYLKSKHVPDVKAALIIGNVEGRVGQECPPWWRMHLRAILNSEISELQHRTLNSVDKSLLANVLDDRRVREKVDDTHELELVVPKSFRQGQVRLFNGRRIYAVDKIDAPIKYRLCRFLRTGVCEWEAVIDVFPIIDGGATQHYVDVIETKSSVWIFGSASIVVYCVALDGNSGALIEKFSVQYLEDGLSWGKERQSLRGSNSDLDRIGDTERNGGSGDEKAR